MQNIDCTKIKLWNHASNGIIVCKSLKSFCLSLEMHQINWFEWSSLKRFEFETLKPNHCQLLNCCQRMWLFTSQQCVDQGNIYNLLAHESYCSLLIGILIEESNWSPKKLILGRLSIYIKMGVNKEEAED